MKPRTKLAVIIAAVSAGLLPLVAWDYQRGELPKCGLYCQPYAEHCPACKDCTKCRACATELNRCSVCRDRR